MRQSLSVLLALFVCIAFAACEQSPVGMDGDSSALTPSGKPAHAHGPVVVDENPDHDWGFNLEDPWVTPAAFSFDEANLGAGSIHVEPITNSGTSARKFILRYESVIAIADFGGFSIDFLIDDAGSSTDEEQFYVNVYTLTPDPDDGSWYDCRFDYIASSGSTSDWTPLGLDASTVKSSGGDKIDDPLDPNDETCPSSLDGMPAGSVIFRTTVNLGDTSANDSGVGGYFDNAVVTVGGSTTTFDFEPNCKDGGWESLTRPDDSGFKNQGQCMKYANTGK